MKKILKQVEQEIANRVIDEDEIADILSSFDPATNRRIISGYASVSIIDRENHKISIPALKDAVAKFMQSDYALVNVFHCLAPDTPILIQNSNRGRKYIPIKDAKVGMKVFTHLGRSQKIKEVIVHNNNGIALKLHLDNGEVITITDEHPVLTNKGWIKAGNLTCNDVLIKLESTAKEYHKRVKNKSHQEIFGVERSRKIIAQISGPRDHYAVTEKHNSRQRKGHTWIETYGHNKPNYGGSAGEKNPQYGNKGRITGPKNPNWKDGASFIPYGKEFNYDLKEKIREACGKKCFLCKAETDYKLVVHHIDCDKKNNDENNLIALCRKCHIKAHNEERMERKNGTHILSIEKFWYSGQVYNLEVENDHSYVGKGIIYHNSDISVGKVLPAWTDPNTGKIYKTEIDDVGWKVIVEVRRDMEIADKVWEEIVKGTLRSFSIAGSSKAKHEAFENGRSYLSIDELEIAECTICEVPVNQESKFSILWDPGQVNI